MVIFHSYVKLPEGICIAIIIPWISHEIPGKSSAPSYRSQLIAVARPGREPGAGIGWKSELETAQNGREHDHKLSNSIKVGGNLFPENLPFVKHGIWGEKSWRYPLSRQIHSKLHWIYHKTWNFEGNEMATFTVEFTPGNEKNMSTWGKIGEFPVVPRAIVETSWNCRFCPPTRDGVMLRKALVFSQRSRSGFRLTHSELLASHDVLAMQSPGISGDVQLIWKKWKFGSSVQMGQGSTYPFQWKSMETIWEFTECPWCLKNCQRVRPPINPRSCVFHGDWFPLSACLRFAWVNAGLNVNMLVIVGYFTMLKVPFWILLITSPLFACSISVALGFCGIFSTICVCVRK